MGATEEYATLAASRLSPTAKSSGSEVESKKQQIENARSSNFRPGNDEYRALAHEIDTCKAAIVQHDDQQIELMEKAELAQKDVAAATQTANEAKKNLSTARLPRAGARREFEKGTG